MYKCLSGSLAWPRGNFWRLSRPAGRGVAPEVVSPFRSRSLSAAILLGLSSVVGGAAGKLYGGPVLRDLLDVYTTLVRAVPELVLILLLYYAGTDALNQLMAAARRRTDGYQWTGSRHLRDRRGAGRLPDGSAARRLQGGAAWPDRSRARLWHDVLSGAPAHHSARHAAARGARPRQSVADRHKGHSTSGGCRCGRTHAGHTVRPGGTTKSYFLFFCAAGLLYLMVTLISNVGIRRIERYARRGMPAVR
jgi:polar amino acid transport system permease protein